MIAFKYRSTIKRIKIKTNQRLDDRMSSWLQGIFNIKYSIIGFKTSDSTPYHISDKYYDVDSFYSRKQKFYGEQVEIIEANDQVQISFTSDNLNSSSFIRPSQPNTSQINQKVSSDDYQDIQYITDIKIFEKSKLQEGRDLNILFDINTAYKKVVSQIIRQLSAFQSTKANYFVFLNNKSTKQSFIQIYIGKILVAKNKFQTQFKTLLKKILNNYQKLKFPNDKQIKNNNPGRPLQPQIDDQAPSFTTYHLQQRMNQQACQDYLIRMEKQKLLKHFQYVKLLQRCQENFSQFYKIFCDSIIDNDYDSFKNQILNKVENNLQILLSNVDEMDLSRPISREQQRKNYRKSTSPVLDIHIVKVETYQEILDTLSDNLDLKTRQLINKYLLEENAQVFAHFADFNSRNIDKHQLTDKLMIFLNNQADNKRPVSRCIPRTQKNIKNEQKNNNYQPEIQQQQNQQIAPMFGPSKQSNFSPIKYMSDIDSNYKQAWGRLQSKVDLFAPQQYGLLYHYLQKRDDSISNFVQQLQWDQQKSLESLKIWLKKRVFQLMSERFSQKQISFLQEIRQTPQIDCIYQNFRYQSDVSNFLKGLRDQLNKRQPPNVPRALHKKSSDSQLLVQKKHSKTKQQRKYSDQEEGRSPKQSQSNISIISVSLYQQKSQPQYQNNQTLNNPWKDEFQQMLKSYKFNTEKQHYMRQAFKESNPEVYVWIRNYIHQRDQIIQIDIFKKDLQIKQNLTKFTIKVVPIFNRLLKCLVQEGLISQKMRKWLAVQFMQLNVSIIASFQLYLQTKNEEDFIDNINIIYMNMNEQMTLYKTYLKRLQQMLKSIAIEDQISSQIFNLYPDFIKAVCQVYFISGDTVQMLDSLHQLHTIQSNLRKINCATLNFSQSNISPFQYFDGSKQIEQINNIFQKSYLNNLQITNGKFNGVKIDKNYKIGRFSIAYGVKLPLFDAKLPNKDQFSLCWKQNFNKSNFVQNSPTQTVQNIILFDFYLYLSVIKYVYKIQDQFDVKQLDPQPLLDYLQLKEYDPIILLGKKKMKVIEYIFKQDIDVMFLQQAHDVDWNDILPHNYSVIVNAESVIIWNKNKIGTKKNSLMNIYKNQLNFNKDSVCLFTDRGYLLISIHLIANNLCIQQLKQVFDSMNSILEQHPLLKIIIGIDANHWIDYDRVSLSVVPQQDDIKTTIKKRTSLQFQINKANQQKSEVKDFLISNLKFGSWKIQNIQGNFSNQFIPNHVHPYDHYIVRANIN